MKAPTIHGRANARMEAALRGAFGKWLVSARIGERFSVDLEETIRGLFAEVQIGDGKIQSARGPQRWRRGRAEGAAP